MAMLELKVQGVSSALSVRRFSVRESLSELYSISAVACSPDEDLDLDAVLFKPACFSIAAGWAFVHGAGSRVYTGLCESIEQLQAEPSGLSTYSIRLVPRLWLLTLRTNYRIFQYLTIPDIVTLLLDEHAVAHIWRIDRAAHPRLDYKVQYGESDFALLSRLCEEAGLSFTFELDDQSQTLLVLSDAPCARLPRAPHLPYVDNPNQAAEKEFVTNVRQFRRGQPLGAVMRDYDFRNPSLPLFAAALAASSAEGLLSTYRYEPGAFRRVTDAQTSTPIADKLGVARHEPSYGQHRVERILLGGRPDGHGVSFDTNALDLAPGTVFSMAAHPHATLDESKRLLVTQFHLEGEHDKEWVTRGQAVFADAPYRPARRTRKPVVHGLQSALITGPEGREIFTDEYGRVRVQFPWDRDGGNNEGSSCWIRVSQGWAGAGFGIHALPRVGQEVLVGFLAGDPDEPVIVGRAPNAHNPPPYSLPANETKTVWRSQSTPGAEGFNEISFEDKKGEEIFYERAEKNKEILVRNDEQIAVGHNRGKLVKRDEDSAILGTRRELIGGDDHRSVFGEQHEHIKGSKSLIINGDWHIRVSGSLLVEAGGEIHLVSGTQIAATAPDITLDAGGFVRANAGGVTLDGEAVLIQAGGAPGSGADSHPVGPEMPLLKGIVLEEPSRPNFKKLPMYPYGQPGGLSGVGPVGVGMEREIICQVICACKKADNGNQKVSQCCVSMALWEYDRRQGFKSTIKAEAPYDMCQSPPTPIMSKNNPQRTTHSKPGGSRVPDVIVVNDGSKPPTQDNIRVVYEIKFGRDKLDWETRNDYEDIAGASKIEVLTPDDCGCGGGNEGDPLLESMRAKDWAMLALLGITMLAVVAAYLDGVPGDEIPATAALERMLPRALPMLRRLLPLLAPAAPPSTVVPF